MATSKKAALKTTLAGIQAFPAKVSAASTKLADKVFPPSGKLPGAAKKPTRAKKAVASPVEVAGKALAAASTKPMRAKAATKPARPPAVLAKSGKLLGADPKGVPGTKAKPAAKRTVAVPEKGLSGVPVHEAHDVAGLAKIVGDFPRGSTFDIMDNRLDVYNLRGRLIAEIKHVAKPVKGAKK